MSEPTVQETDSMQPPQGTGPVARRRSKLILLYLGAVLALLTAGAWLVPPDEPSFFVVLAGPWSAKIYGHSCGFESNMPWASGGLVAFGLGAAFLAYRVRRSWALVPLGLIWFPAWVLAAGVGILNMLQ